MVAALPSTFTLSLRLQTTRDRYSRLTWWQMPVPGGTTLKLSNERCAHFRNL